MPAEEKIVNDKKLEYILSNMVDILNYSNSLLKDSYRMLLTKTSKEHIFIHRCKFLRKTQLVFLKLGVIELCKLFGKPRTNHFSLYQIQSLFPVANETTILIIAHLNDYEVREKIKLLEELRDRHFAHTDIDIEFKKENGKRSIHEIKFYFDDAFYLINIAELIIAELYEKLKAKKNYKIIKNEDDADIFLTTQLGLLNKIGKNIIQKNI